MTSYSIDPTVFIPPGLPENEEQSTPIKKEFIDYSKTIENCIRLMINQNNISVYLFKGIKNNFDTDYVKKASKLSGIPMQFLMITLRNIEKILYMKLSEYGYHFGTYVEENKYFFDKWFNIKNINKSNCTLTPSLNKLITQDNDLESRLIMIGILNQYVYKTPDFHFLILNDNNSSVSIKSNINFSFLSKNYPNELLNTQVQTRQIDNITIEPEKYKTVHDACEAAKNNFTAYLVFGDDVNAGIKTIRDSAGPPDRIFAYLETLKDFCIYKQNYNTPYDDADVLNMLGCICHHENLNDQKVKNDRMFDNGYAQDELFELHLCPNTFPPAPRKSRTVRIYFKWNANQKKVIIGWIGDHRLFRKNLNF